MTRSVEILLIQGTPRRARTSNARGQLPVPSFTRDSRLVTLIRRLNVELCLPTHHLFIKRRFYVRRVLFRKA